MSANKAACASCSEAMRRNIIERRSQRGRAGKLASPPRLAPGRLSTERCTRHNFADSGDKRKHNVLCGRLPGTSTPALHAIELFLWCVSTLCREHAINLGGRGVEPSCAAVEVRKLQYMDERQTCAGTSTPWPYRASRAGPEMRVADAPMGTPKNKTPLGRRRGLVARCDDRTKLVYAVAYRERRRRANARRPPQAARSPGSPAPTMGPGTAWKGTPEGKPVTNVSGPVPKENVAPVIVVLAVTPERARVKVAGPIT